MSPSDIYSELNARSKNAVANKKMTKFIEAAWRFIFYSIFQYIGITTLLYPERKPWTSDSIENWTDWPLQTVDSGVYFYYLVELGCYLHQLLWTEVTRKDSLEMITHHFVTIFLIIFSYTSNFTRVGSTVLILHDTADIFLELAKCFNYMSKVKGQEWASKVTDSLFGVFTLSFFLTRLVLYPKFVFYNSYIQAEQIWGKEWPGFWVYFVLLMALQLLHIFWFYTICKMIYRLLTTGIEKDERSDGEESEEDEAMSKQQDTSSNTTSSSTGGGGGGGKNSAKVSGENKKKL